MKKKFWNLFVIVILALGCICTTGCKKEETPTEAPAETVEVEVVSEDDVSIVDKARQGVSWWTRHTDKQSWTNPSGTKIEIKERRKEGDYKITVTYGEKDLNKDSWEEWHYTGDGTAVLYVDKLTDELINYLREQ